MEEFRNLDSKADNAERNRLSATNPLVGPHFVLDMSFRSFLAIWLPLLSNLLCAVAFSRKKSKLLWKNEGERTEKFFVDREEKMRRKDRLFSSSLSFLADVILSERVECRDSDKKVPLGCENGF